MILLRAKPRFPKLVSLFAEHSCVLNGPRTSKQPLQQPTRSCAGALASKTRMWRCVQARQPKTFRTQASPVSRRPFSIYAAMRMVRSDLGGAGVMFSIDTETGFDKVVLINATWGLGENVVQGT